MKTKARVTSVLLFSAALRLGAQVPSPAVAPDPPTGSAREAELARKASLIFEAFTDSNSVYTRDGQKVVFSSNRSGLPQLYVAAAASPSSPAVRVVTTTERIPYAVPLADGKTLLFQSDRGADENWSFFLCGLDGSGLVEVTSGATLHRDNPIVPEAMPRTIFYSARAVSESGSRLYSAPLVAGAAEKKIYEDTVPGFLEDVRADGKRGLWLRFVSLSDATLVLVDLEKGTGKTIYPPPGSGKVTIWNVRFSADGRRIFVATDAGGEQGLVLALDANGRELARYAETRPATADLEGMAVSKKGNRLAVGVGAGNRNEIRILDAATLRPAASVELPLGTGSVGDFSEDGERLTATWSTPDSPPEIYAIEVKTGKTTPLRSEPRPTLAGFPNVEASIVEVPAFDGRKLPTNVYLPAGAAGKKLPVLVVFHGGPAGSSQIRWSPAVRFFTSLGYAVVEPNVRGSSGFGRAFELADNGPRRPDAFRDVETTARWVSAQPWADPDRLVIYGTSYGGYTVLIALERWPDVWKAGVDLVGIANLTTFLRSTNGTIRQVFKLEFGDVDADAAFLKTISPIEEIDRIVDPVFVYAGANDPRVPRPESDQVVRALRARGVPVAYMVAENEGHSLARRENQVAFFSRAAAFLETQLARPK